MPRRRTVEFVPVPDPVVPVRSLGLPDRHRARFGRRVWAHPSGHPWLGEVLTVQPCRSVSISPAWPHSALALERGLSVSSAPAGDRSIAHLGTEAFPFNAVVLSRDALFGLEHGPHDDVQNVFARVAVAFPAPIDRRAIPAALLDVQARLGFAIAHELAAALEALGLQLVTAQGASLCLSDFRVQPARDVLADRALERTTKVVDAYFAGTLAESERAHRTWDAWGEAADRMRASAQVPTACEYLEAHEADARERHAGLPGVSHARVFTIGFGLGLGSPPELPVRHSIAEGLTPLEAWIRATEVRRTASESEDRLRRVSRIHRELASLLGSIRIVEHDCGNTEPRWVSGLAEAPERALGRTAVRLSTGGRQDEAFAGPVTRDVVTQVRERGGDEACLRFLPSCRTQGGVCAACYGADPATGSAVTLGRPVGRLAARVLSVWSMRLPSGLEERSAFHICGPALDALPRVPASLPQPCTVRYEGLRVAHRPDLDALHPWVVLNDDGQLTIEDELESARYAVPRGTSLAASDHAHVEANAPLARAPWHGDDSIVVDLPAGVEGRVEVVDMTPRTVLDDVTGLYRDILERSDDPAAHPGFILRFRDDGYAERSVRIPIPEDAHFLAREGATVRAGDALAVRARATPVGLSRFEDLLRSRRAARTSPFAPVDGWMEPDGSGTYRIRGADGVEHSIRGAPPASDHDVHARTVRRGDALGTDCRDHHEMLHELGAEYVHRHLCAELELVFPRASGAHIELLARAIVSRDEGEGVDGATRLAGADTSLAWLDAAARLRAGNAVELVANGNSMRGLIEPGDEVVIFPLDADDVLNVGDVVLCTVRGHLRLHAVHLMEAERFMIGSHRGALDGWVSRHDIHGRVTWVSSP